MRPQVTFCIPMLIFYNYRSTVYAQPWLSQITTTAGQAIAIT